MSVKFIIVTGEPRSGTSMTMGVLKELGVPVWGSEKMDRSQDKNPLMKKMRQALGLKEPQLSEQDKLTIAKRKERVEKLNEKFYEVGHVVTRGINLKTLQAQEANINKSNALPALKLMHKEMIKQKRQEIECHNGDAVKIITTGLHNTELSILKQSRIIWCLRNPIHIALSQKKLESGEIQIAQADEKDQTYWTSPEREFTPASYLRGSSSILRLLFNHPELKDNIITVDFEDMHNSPAIEIAKINAHLKINPNQQVVNGAVASVDPLKKRSSIDLPMPADKQIAWQTAKDVYVLTKQNKFNEAYLKLNEYRAYYAQEQRFAPYLDTEVEGSNQPTWWFVQSPQLLRQMKDNPNLRQQMIDVHNQPAFINNTCDKCPLYNRFGAQYTVNRPSELGGDLTRAKVDCPELKKEVTLEVCQNHWIRVKKNTV